jgi:hypothetical protein
LEGEDAQRRIFDADDADDVPTTLDGNVVRHAGLALLRDCGATLGKPIRLPESGE